MERKPSAQEWSLRRCTGVWYNTYRTATTQRCLRDRDALDVEDQVRVGGNVRGSTLLAVFESGRNGETALAASSHASNTDVPALDDLADTELEGERLTLLVCYVVVSIVNSVQPMECNSQSKTLPFFSLPM